MYSMDPWMDPWGTLSINWAFLWRLLIQSHPKPRVNKKRRNKAKYLTLNSLRLKFVKKANMPNSVESLGYIKCYSSSSSRSAKSPSNSIRHNCQKICCCSRKAIRKKATFFYVINKPIIYKFFKDFTNNRTKTKRAVDLSPKFLNTGTTYETFKQFGKQDSFRHILKCSACMYESLGSQFFRSTTGIQSGLDAFDESRFAMTFLINHSTSMIRRNMYIKIL